MKTLEQYQNKHEYGIPREACEGYDYIWAWGKLLGSMDYYIVAQINQAISDHAPMDATYYDDVNKKWHTFNECHEVTQNRLNKILFR